MIAGLILIGALIAISIVAVAMALIATFAPHLLPFRLSPRSQHRPGGDR